MIQHLKLEKLEPVQIQKVDPVFPPLGLPGGKAPENFQDLMFWALITGIGQTYHRLVLPYLMAPLVLVKIVDPSIDIAEKCQLARWFLSLPRCCLCAGVGQPLRDLVTTEDDLLTGVGAKILQSIGSTKITNIEVENNFARAHSSQVTGRGRNQFFGSLAAKHLLSEIKLQHRKTIQQHDTDEGNKHVASRTLPLQGPSPLPLPDIVSIAKPADTGADGAPLPLVVAESVLSLAVRQ